MAIFHLHVGIVSRKTGRSSVAASAYRRGEKLHNERDGITHDYTRKTGVVHSEIMLPENAPIEYKNPAVFWNAVEKAEKRIDAQTARDIDIALPVEFDRQEQIEIMRKYIQENFVDKGMCADFAIHDKGDGNPHAHILLTIRNVTENGFSGKNREWNKTDLLEQWRENWADICNEKLQEKGLNEKIDHRTLEAQGINRNPTIHIGVVAKSMERAGRDSDRMREYREISLQNEALTPEEMAEFLHGLKTVYLMLDKEISALQQENVDIQREIKSLQFKSEAMTERAEQIQAMKKRLDVLKVQRQVKDLANKKAVDEQIQRLEQSHEQARSYFKRNYYIFPEETAAEAKRLEYKVKDMERVQEWLQDKLTPLVADKDIFSLEYQRQKLLAKISPNRQRIQDELMKLDKESRPQRQSLQDEIARTRSERTLDIVTERNFQEILREVRPEQTKELIKRRERQMIQEHIHNKKIERNH